VIVFTVFGGSAGHGQAAKENLDLFIRPPPLLLVIFQKFPGRFYLPLSLITKKGRFLRGEG
jgi:hypothetical protein